MCDLPEKHSGTMLVYYGDLDSRQSSRNWHCGYLRGIAAETL